MRKSWEILGLLTVALLVVPVSRAADKEDDRRRLDKAEQWELAAQNRDWAASTQQAQAEDMLANARELMKKEYAGDAERTRNMNTAGDMQRMAGDLYGASVLNLDMAIANRQKAVEEYGKLRDEERQRSARSKGDVARKDAIQACLKAAEAYELAAESFAPENGNDAGRITAVVEKAASWRENLAGRK